MIRLFKQAPAGEDCVHCAVGSLSDGAHLWKEQNIDANFVRVFHHLEVEGWWKFISCYILIQFEISHMCLSLSYIRPRYIWIYDVGCYLQMIVTIKFSVLSQRKYSIQQFWMTSTGFPF